MNKIFNSEELVISIKDNVSDKLPKKLLEENEYTELGNKNIIESLGDILSNVKKLQRKTDNNLATQSKDIVGAINELYDLINK